MKVKILEKCYTGTVGNMFAGEEYELDDSIAQKLIDRNLAEESKKKAGRAKKKFSDRSFGSDDIVTPEDD